MTPTLLTAVIGEHASRFMVTSDLGVDEPQILPEAQHYRYDFPVSFIEFVRIADIGRRYGAFSGSTLRGAPFSGMVSRTVHGCRPLPWPWRSPFF